MMIGQQNYNRVSKDMPCPVCGEPDWCLVSDDGNWCICPRTSEGSKRSVGEAGYKHKLNSTSYKPPKRIIKSKNNKPNIRLIRKIYNSLGFHSDKLKPLAGKLKINVWILLQMGVGYKDFVWYFPMYNSLKEIIGLKKRNLKGDKWCQTGSRLGVSLSMHFRPSQSVYICEGESDTASMLSRGYNAIGRANASSCRVILKELLKDCPEVNIVSDFDAHGSGYKCACRLAEFLYRPDRRVFTILHREHKDIREWINSKTFTHQEFINLKQEYKEE